MNYSSTSLKMKRVGTSRNNPSRGRIKPSNAGNQASQSLEGLYSNDRLVNVVTSVLGCTAKVMGENGKQFEGVFKTISPEASLVLGKASQVEEQVQNGVVDGMSKKPEMFEQFVMHQKDWVRVEFKDVNLEECCNKKEFKTDVAIGGSKRMNGQRGKELEKWEPGDISDLLESTGLDGQHNMENGWSAEKMFETNEQRYGVKSTYNEKMEEYTTKLEKADTPEFRERERFAAQIAETISRESPFERSTFDSGRSEEQLYSAVVRNRSSALNWRQSNSDRPSERDQRTVRMPYQSIGLPGSARREPVKSQQIADPTKVQVKEKVEKPTTGTAVECRPEQKLGALSEIVKAEPKTGPNVSEAKPLVTPTNSSVAPQMSVSKEPSPDLVSNPDVAIPETRSKEFKDLRDFSVNFQLPEKEKKSPKVKKVTEEEEKTSNEATNKEEKDEEVQTCEEMKADLESNEKKAKSELNPNAQEFRPRTKRNTPSPRSNSTASSSGAPSPYPNNSPFSPYPPNGIYSRNGPRGRGIRQEYMEPTPGYINASSAAGAPFFAHHMPPQFMHQPSPPGMSYGIRHPGIQHQLFIQQHPHQGPMMLPVGQMPPGHYADNAIYYGPAMPTMVQSPPQITSPSLQQSQFNFPPPAIPQPVNQVRPVSQPPAVIPQQPPAPIFIQPTQIMTANRPPPQPFQGN